MIISWPSYVAIPIKRKPTRKEKHFEESTENKSFVGRRTTTVLLQHCLVQNRHCVRQFGTSERNFGLSESDFILMVRLLFTNQKNMTLVRQSILWFFVFLRWTERIKAENERQYNGGKKPRNAWSPTGARNTSTHKTQRCGVIDVRTISSNEEPPPSHDQRKGGLPCRIYLSGFFLQTESRNCSN